MKAKWIILLLFALLTALAVGTAMTAQAIEAHYFTWAPAEPQEGGGTVTFTATPPEGYSNLEWSRSAEPGGEACGLAMGNAGDTSVSTELLKSGVYQVCLKITFADGISPELNDIQPVAVTNLPPALGTPTTVPAITVAGYPVTASVPITEYDSGISCTVDFGDGTEPVSGILNGSCTALHTYTAAGNYTVTFSVVEPGFDAVTATASHTVVPPYANTVSFASDSVQTPEAALHAPDGQYASVFSDSGIILDLGAPIQGALLTIYHSTKSPACTVGAEVGPIGVTTAGADHSLLSLSALAPKIQYIGINCGTLAKKAVFKLDAIQVEPNPVPTGYAIAAMPNAGEVQNTGAAVGAPDGIYATIGKAGGMIMVDMGAPLQPILTIYHSADSAACVLLLAGQYAIGTTQPGATSTSFIMPPVEDPPPYFGIECAAGEGVFELDAAWMQSTIDEPTGYAVATFSDNYVVDPGAALGAPDKTYATIIAGSSDYSFLLDLGAPMQGMLTVYHSARSESCEVDASLTLIDAQGEILGVTHSGVEGTTLFIGGQTRYVWFRCYLSAGEIFELDAIHVDQSVTPTGYALTAMAATNVVNPDAALGAPDGQYATIDGSGTILLDLGAVYEGRLKVYYVQSGGSCQIHGTTTFIGPPVALEVIEWGLVLIFNIPEGGVRYVEIDCTGYPGEVFELDAIRAGPVLEPTGYAVDEYYATADVQNAYSALGEPDDAYATITAENGGLILDLGGPLQGDLTVYYSTTSPACFVFATPTITGMQPMPVGTTTPGLGQSTFAIATDIQYVWIMCETLPRKTVFELDAVQVQPGTLSPTGYAVAVTAVTSDVKDVAKAIGAPDDLFAAITAANGTIVLDLGGLVQGPLTVYHSSASAQCEVGMSTEMWGSAIPGGGYTTVGATTSVFAPTEDYRYIMVTCYTLAKKQVFELDAVGVTLPSP